MPAAEADEAIRAGRVWLSGRIVRQPLTPVRPGDEIRIDGHKVSLVAPTRVIAFHKPAGVVTAPGEGGVFELLVHALPPELSRFEWHAVGRLDRNTTGLLLFTNDERLVEHVTTPATHLPKRYVAQVQGTATDEKVDPLRRGITLDDGPARPAKVKVVDASTVELTLTEGRNHQVKRMLGAVGLPVRALHRASVGGVELDVSLGELRLLTDDEVRRGLGYGESSPDQPKSDAPEPPTPS